MIGAVVLAVLRSPLLLLHGRVFAEEGTVYLQHGWSANVGQTLLAVHEGYFSLLMNCWTLLDARVLPLEWAARANVLGAFGVLLITVYCAITCERFIGFRARALAMAVVLLAPAIEVWMTLLDAQFYLPVCAGLICISSEHRHRWFRSAVLVLAGLTGPASCVLAPFFLFQAWRRRSTIAWLQAVIVTVCSLVEGTILLHSLHVGRRSLDLEGKAEWFGPIVFVKVLSVTLFTRLGSFAAQHILNAHPNIFVGVIFWMAFLACAALFWFVSQRGGMAGRTLFVLACASLLFNYVGDPAPVRVIFTGESRYVFSALLLFWLALLTGYLGTRSDLDLPRYRPAALVLALALVSGTIDAIGYWTRFQRVEPRWSGQVAAWRADPAAPIRVPPPDWADHIHLDPR